MHGQGAVNIAEDIGHGAENVAHDIGNGVGNMVENARHAMENGTGHLLGMDDANRGTYGTFTSSEDASYTTYGGTSSNPLTRFNSAWIWLIVGITGVIIVALTWYYVTQNADSDNKGKH